MPAHSASVGHESGADGPGPCPLAPRASGGLTGGGDSRVAAEVHRDRFLNPDRPARQPLAGDDVREFVAERFAPAALGPARADSGMKSTRFPLVAPAVHHGFPLART